MRKLASILAVVALFATMAWAEEGREKELSRVKSAQNVLNEIMATPDKGIPEEILGAADCVVVIPSMLKGGFIVGGRYGKGIATCRTRDDHWSAVAPVRVEGGSWGLQIGGQAVDLVMLVMNKQGMEHLLSSKFQVGVDASAAAGPVGRHAEAGTDWKMRSELLTYSRARGAFAGIALNGAVVKQDTDDTLALYNGKDVPFRTILTGQVPSPAGTEPFVAEVGRYFRAAKAGESAATRAPQSQPSTTGGAAGTAAKPSSTAGESSMTGSSVAGSTQANPPASTGTTTETTGQPSSSDQVRSKIQNALRNEPSLATGNVSVSVTDNAVELSGSVPTEKDKATIRRLAEENAGGRKVDDSKLVVK